MCTDLYKCVLNDVCTKWFFGLVIQSFNSKYLETRKISKVRIQWDCPNKSYNRVC